MLVSLPAARRLGGVRVAAPETDLQLMAEATRIQPEQTPAQFHLISRFLILDTYKS